MQCRLGLAQTNHHRHFVLKSKAPSSKSEWGFRVGLILHPQIQKYMTIFFKNVCSNGTNMLIIAIVNHRHMQLGANKFEHPGENPFISILCFKRWILYIGSPHTKWNIPNLSLFQFWWLWQNDTHKKKISLWQNYNISCDQLQRILNTDILTF